MPDTVAAPAHGRRTAVPSDDAPFSGFAAWMRLRASCAVALCYVIGGSGCGQMGTLEPSAATELAYWRTLTGAAGEAQEELVARFNAANPGFQVRSEFQGGYSDLATKLIAAGSSGKGPAVTQLGTFEIRQFAEAGLLVDLRPFLTGEDGLDTSGWPSTMFEAGEVNGGIYWLPFNVTVPVLYCNVDALREAGLSGPPESWEAFFEYARHLTVRDAAGRVTRHGAAFWDITWPFISMIWSEGGELTDRACANVTLNDPVAVELMMQVQRLVEEGCAIMPSKAAGGHRAAFIGGRAAMILDSPAVYRDMVEANQAFQAVAAPYPAGKAGRVYAPGGGGIAMTAATPPGSRAAAWRFMKFLLSPEALAHFACRSGYLAFTRESREVLGPLPAERLPLYQALDFVRADFSVNMSPPVRNSFDWAFQSIVIDRANVRDTLDKADRRAEREIARLRVRTP